MVALLCRTATALEMGEKWTQMLIQLRVITFAWYGLLFVSMYLQYLCYNVTYLCSFDEAALHSKRISNTFYMMHRHCL